MYRRKLETLPPDFSFPDTLEGMGYFLNENDQVRMLDDPDLPFHYFASKNERFLDTQKEAMNKCMSDIVLQRLADLGMERVRLPAGSRADEPHVPILVSENISRAKRIVVYMGEIQELGFLSGRLMSADGLNIGSAVNLARDVLATHPTAPMSSTSGTPSTGTDTEPESSVTSPSPSHKVDSDVALVLTNPGQLTWYRRGQKAVSFDGWYALPRPSAVHEARTITRAANSIPRNAGPLEHFRCVFEDIIAPLFCQEDDSDADEGQYKKEEDQKRAMKNIRIDVIAVNHSIDDLLTILEGEYTHEHTEREQSQKQQPSNSTAPLRSPPHSNWHQHLSAVACICANVYPLDTILQLAGSQGAPQASTNSNSDTTNRPTEPTSTSNAESVQLAAGAELAEFWSRRARIYVVDGAPLGTPMTGRRMTGCNVYSSGVPDYAEHIVPLSYPGFLDYFKLVARDETYENTPQDDVFEESGGEEGQSWDQRDGDEGLASREWPREGNEEERGEGVVEIVDVEE